MAQLLKMQLLVEIILETTIDYDFKVINFLDEENLSIGVEVILNKIFNLDHWELYRALKQIDRALKELASSTAKMLLMEGVFKRAKEVNDSQHYELFIHLIYT